jgi:hypothetical protein
MKNPQRRQVCSWVFPTLFLSIPKSVLDRPKSVLDRLKSVFDHFRARPEPFSFCHRPSRAADRCLWSVVNAKACAGGVSGNLLGRAACDLFAPQFHGHESVTFSRISV